MYLSVIIIIQHDRLLHVCYCRLQLNLYLFVRVQLNLYLFVRVRLDHYLSVRVRLDYYLPVRVRLDYYLSVRVQLNPGVLCDRWETMEAEDTVHLLQVQRIEVTYRIQDLFYTQETWFM